MTAAHVLAVLLQATAPRPVAGCGVAQEEFRSAPAEVSAHDLAGMCSAPLAADLGHLPSLQAALNDLDGATKGDEVQRARSALGSTLDAVCSRSTLLPAAPAAVDEHALQAILAQPQFERRIGSGPELSTVLERLWDVIKELLYSEGFSQYAIYSREVFLLLVMIAAAWLAIRVRRGAPGIASTTRAPPASVGPGVTLDDLVAEARLARQRGDLVKAIALEMASVRWTAEGGGALGAELAQTDREWLERVQRTSPTTLELPRLGELVFRFERLFYGAVTPTTPDLEAFCRDAEAVRLAVVGARSP